MLIKPDATATVPAATVCGNCGMEERRLIHHVRHRGLFRRLCTSCVLRLHPQSFCPTCFQVYPPSPSNDAVLTCSKCYSLSHSHCVEAGTGPTSPPTPYICPLCLHPNTPFFKLKSAKEANVRISEDCRVLDRESAKKLLAAAKIASASMNKAAVAAKAEAERRAKEAAFTRKRAKEALEHVAHLVMKEKLRKKEAGLAGSGGGVVINAGGVRMERGNNVNVSTSYRNGSAVSVLGRSTVVDRVDNSNQILAALNAVELKENEKTRGGITPQDVRSGVPLIVDHAPMDVDGKGRMAVNAVGELVGNDSDHVNFTILESGVENLDTREEKIEDVNDLVQYVEDQMQHEENSLGGAQHDNGAQL
ncbi:hypothetical protein DH2020_024171 [Rehmannia glutinosa]|uniref:Uncharacterized protein n=1 Tax=Rehmannia glutinosa TaxID=99300 RepID=A0ABR0WAE3_REHGL